MTILSVQSLQLFTIRNDTLW